MAQGQTIKVNPDKDDSEKTKVKDLQTRAENMNSATVYDSSAPLARDEKIALAIVGTVVAGLTGLAVWLGIKEEKKYRQEEAEREEERKAKEEAKQAKAAEVKEWKEHSRNEGYIVYQLADGNLMAVPVDSVKESRFKDPR